MSKTSFQEKDLKIEIKKCNNDIEKQFIPPILYGKSQEELKDILSNSLLLDAILNTTHPEILHQRNTLKEAYKTNIRFSEELLNQESFLIDLQKKVEYAFSEVKKYEKQWEDLNKKMEILLKPYSKSYLFIQLEDAIKEADNFSNSLQELFLKNKEDNDLHEFIKKYKQVRKLYYLRCKKKDHWESGKILGLE
ncbi:hypothetical protein PCANB_002581 [Pneumocystis canis]|nr:hypothetical protein PCANB_002581 [Pneumocystis canis]